MQNSKKINSTKQTLIYRGSVRGKGNTSDVTDRLERFSVSSGENISQQKTNPQEQVDARFQSALTEDVVINSLSSETQNKPPKKNFSKMIIFFAVFFLVLGVLVFLFMRFRDTGQMLLGNKGEIVWWGVQHDRSVYQLLIDKFEKDNPNIKIRYEKQSQQDYLVRLLGALASGNGPDIFEIHNTWPVMMRNELSAIPSSIMSNEEFIKSFYPIIVSNLTLEKGIVGIPLEYDALTLFINEDVFTSALKSPPEKWSDLQTLAPQLTQTGERGAIIQGGVAFGITDNVDHWPEIIALLLFQNNVNPARPVGKFAIDVFSFYNSFSKSKVWNNTLPKSTTAFSRGELAMYFGPTRRASEILKTNPNIKFRTVKLPQLPKNKSDDPDYSYATYWVHGVSEKSKLKVSAWNFLKYLSSEESLKEINENIAKLDTFKRVYPRPSMNADMIQDPVLGSVIFFAYDARSFYLADNTYDGASGINTEVNKIYKSMIGGSISEKVLLTKSQELSQILGKFGVRVR